MEAGTEHGKERTGLQRMYWTHIRQHACEFVTAMILLFNTCSASYLASGISEQNVTISTEPALPIEGAFVAGFTVFSLLTMFFYVSVAHISPTVTFGFALGGSFDWKLMPSYIVCQVLGGVVGAMLAQYTAGNGKVVGAVELALDMPTGDLVRLFLSEMQVNFILCLCTNLVVGNPKWDHPVATFMIGIVVFTGVIAGSGSGAGQMNPAKVLSTAILSGNFNHHWVWWAASIAGAAQNALIYRLCFAENNNLLLTQLKSE